MPRLLKALTDGSLPWPWAILIFIAWLVSIGIALPFLLAVMAYNVGREKVGREKVSGTNGTVGIVSGARYMTCGVRRGGRVLV